MRSLLALLLCSVLVSCAPAPYRATFVAAVYERPSLTTIAPHVDFPSRDPDSGEAMAQVMRSNVFWRVYLLPRLPATLAKDLRVKEGLQVVLMNDARVEGRLVSTFDVVLVEGGKPAFDALVGAYYAYSLDLIQGRLEYARDARLIAERVGNASEMLRISEALDTLVEQQSELKAALALRPMK